MMILTGIFPNVNPDFALFGKESKQWMLLQKFGSIKWGTLFHSPK
jgi:hypothetical protein